MQKDGRTPEPYPSLKSVQTHRMQLLVAYKQQWRKPFNDKTSCAGLLYVFEWPNSVIASMHESNHFDLSPNLVQYLGFCGGGTNTAASFSIVYLNSCQRPDTRL